MTKGRKKGADMSEQKTETYLTVPQVAKRLNLKTDKIYHDIRTGKLEAVKPGGGRVVRVPESAIKTYLQSNSFN